MIRAEAILPTTELNTRAMWKALDAGVLEVAEGIKKDLERPTRTWDNKPTFKIKRKRSANKIVFIIGTDSTVGGVNIFGLVDAGSPPHDIYPKNASRLAYKSSFTPKTTPGKLTSRAGGKKGATVYRDWVQHPGFEGRDFIKTVAEKWRKPSKYKRRMNRAMKDAAMVSGFMYWR